MEEREEDSETEEEVMVCAAPGESAAEAHFVSCPVRLRWLIL